MTFRTINGKTFMSKRAEPALPKDATRKQKAIMSAYYEGENGPTMHREKSDNGPMK